MYCKHCNNQINKGQKYCSQCGMKAEDNSNGKKKTYKGVIIICFALFVIIGVAIVFVVSTVVRDFIENAYSDEEYIEADSVNIGEAGRESGESEGKENIKIKNDNSGEIPLLACTLSFNNEKMSSDAGDWYNLIFGSGYYNTGSVNDFFTECSKGNFMIRPAYEEYGIYGDGIIELELDMDHPNINMSVDLNGFYDAAKPLYRDVLNLADEYVDFDIYDADANGVIEPDELMIVFIFAGYEDNVGYYNENTTWSKFFTNPEYAYVDGIYVNQTVFISEKSPYSDTDPPLQGIGILCHEIGHYISLPDLYDRDLSSQGLGFHSLMAAGALNKLEGGAFGTHPAPFTAWEMEFLDYERPQIVSESGTYQVYSRSSDDYNILKIYEGDDYYLIENVDFEGFGKGLGTYFESPGIAIWYVDTSVVEYEMSIDKYTVNNDEENYGIRLIEAHGTTDMHRSTFDYSRKHDHYHYLDGDNIYESEEGLKIEIISNPGEVMEVTITFP